MITAEYAYSSRQARDLLQHLGKDVMNEMGDLGMEWVEHYRTVAQPAIFEAHEGAARSGGGGGGHPAWATLTEGYLASRRKRESMHAEDIMQLTGDLRRDLETGGGEGYTTSRTMGDSLLIEIGSHRAYGVHAGGAQGGPRQVMYLTAETIQQFEVITNAFISKLIVKARSAAAASDPARIPSRGGGRL